MIKFLDWKGISNFKAFEARMGENRASLGRVPFRHLYSSLRTTEATGRVSLKKKVWGVAI